MTYSFEECKSLFKGKLLQSKWNEDIKRISSYFPAERNIDSQILYDKFLSKLPQQSSLKEILLFKNYYYCFYQQDNELFYIKKDLSLNDNFQDPISLNYKFLNGINIFKTILNESSLEVLVFDKKNTLFVSTNLSFNPSNVVEFSIVIDIVSYQHHLNKYFFVLTNNSIHVLKQNIDGTLYTPLIYQILHEIKNKDSYHVVSDDNSDAFCFLFSGKSGNTFSAIPINVKQSISLIEKSISKVKLSVIDIGIMDIDINTPIVLNNVILDTSSRNYSDIHLNQEVSPSFSFSMNFFSKKGEEEQFYIVDYITKEKNLFNFLVDKGSKLFDPSFTEFGVENNFDLNIFLIKKHKSNKHIYKSNKTSRSSHLTLECKSLSAAFTSRKQLLAGFLDNDRKTQDVLILEAFAYFGIFPFLQSLFYNPNSSFFSDINRVYHYIFANDYLGIKGCYNSFTSSFDKVVDEISFFLYNRTFGETLPIHIQSNLEELKTFSSFLIFLIENLLEKKKIDLELTFRDNFFSNTYIKLYSQLSQVKMYSSLLYLLSELCEDIYFELSFLNTQYFQKLYHSLKKESSSRFPILSPALKIPSNDSQVLTLSNEFLFSIYKSFSIRSYANIPFTLFVNSNSISLNDFKQLIYFPITYSSIFLNEYHELKKLFIGQTVGELEEHFFNLDNHSKEILSYYLLIFSSLSYRGSSDNSSILSTLSTCFNLSDSILDILNEFKSIDLNQDFSIDKLCFSQEISFLTSRNLIKILIKKLFYNNKIYEVNFFLNSLIQHENSLFLNDTFGCLALGSSLLPSNWEVTFELSRTLWNKLSLSAPQLANSLIIELTNFYCIWTLKNQCLNKYLANSFSHLEINAIINFFNNLTQIDLEKRVQNSQFIDILIGFYLRHNRITEAEKLNELHLTAIELTPNLDKSIYDHRIALIKAAQNFNQLPTTDHFLLEKLNGNL